MLENRILSTYDNPSWCLSQGALALTEWLSPQAESEQIGMDCHYFLNFAHLPISPSSMKAKQDVRKIGSNIV